MNKQTILKKIKKSKEKPAEGRNSMGCSESNYNNYFLVGGCFNKKELEKMDEDCLKHLLKLAKYAGDVFY